jgi:hypothetical protein
MWNIQNDAKYYKYAKESELHHGRIAMILPFINTITYPYLLCEILRLYCIEKPFMIKESHDLGNYFGLNMNNKNVILKTEMYVARAACLYILYEYLKTITL